MRSRSHLISLFTSLCRVPLVVPGAQQGEEVAIEDQSVDKGRSEAFAGRMMEVLNGAGMALMTSIGHQVGLFDAMVTLPPATSQQIAEAAGLTERYVREWLGAMVTGGRTPCQR